jgi:hypothetical protein
MDDLGRPPHAGRGHVSAISGGGMAARRVQGAWKMIGS